MSPMTASRTTKTNMRSNYEGFYWEIEAKVERIGDWCDKHIRQAKEHAAAFCARNYSYPFVERIHQLLKVKRRQHRLIMGSRCIGCDPDYRKMIGL